MRWLSLRPCSAAQARTAARSILDPLPRDALAVLRGVLLRATSMNGCSDFSSLARFFLPRSIS